MKTLSILMTCLLLTACASDFHPYEPSREPPRMVLEVEDVYRCLGPDEVFRPSANMVCNEVARLHMVCACP